MTWLTQNLQVFLSADSFRADFYEAVLVTLTHHVHTKWLKTVPGVHHSSTQKVHKWMVADHHAHALVRFLQFYLCLAACTPCTSTNRLLATLWVNLRASKSVSIQIQVKVRKDPQTIILAPANLEQICFMQDKSSSYTSSLRGPGVLQRFMNTAQHM